MVGAALDTVERQAEGIFTQDRDWLHPAKKYFS